MLLFAKVFVLERSHDNGYDNSYIPLIFNCKNCFYFAKKQPPPHDLKPVPGIKLKVSGKNVSGTILM